jgi:hypothetical protein
MRNTEVTKNTVKSRHISLYARGDKFYSTRITYHINGGTPNLYAINFWIQKKEFINRGNMKNDFYVISKKKKKTTTFDFC